MITDTDSFHATKCIPYEFNSQKTIITLNKMATLFIRIFSRNGTNRMIKEYPVRHAWEHFFAYNIFNSSTGKTIIRRNNDYDYKKQI